MKYIGNKKDWNKSGIYKISNSIDDRIYIGSTNCLRERYRSHRNKLKVGKNASIHLQRFATKYGIETLIFEILEIVEIERLIEREDFYISKMKPEFNMMSTAIRVVGSKHTENTKEKMSEIAKNSFLSGRTIWNKGKKLSEEEKQPFKCCSKGIPRISNRSPVCLYDFDGITLLKCYDSGTEASKETGVSISSIYSNVSGRYKKTNKGIWKRKDISASTYQ